ncbi:hypothetical protein ACFLQ5_01860 [Bacteroidota bacterium]
MKILKRNSHVLILFLLISVPILAQNQIPITNKIIIDYVNSVIGKKVDRGECWDLAYQALTKAGAQWDGAYNYGKLVDPEKEIIHPGDIIQFKNVKVKYKVNRAIYTETMKHHTAIVYQVIGKGVYKIAHQNTSEFKKKVGISDFTIDNVVAGKLKFYRPIPA